MIQEVKKAGIKCQCGAELIVVGEYVICQICKKKVEPGDKNSKTKKMGC